MTRTHGKAHSFAPAALGVALVLAASTATADPSHWDTTTIFDDSNYLTMGWDTSVSLALDGSNHPHVAFTADYLDLSGGGWGGETGIFHASHDGTSWSGSNAIPYAFSYANASLALTASGPPHVSAVNEWDAEVRHARWNGTTWVQDSAATTSGDPLGWLDIPTSMVVDSGGKPHISYLAKAPMSEGSNRLMCASWNGSAWVETTVEEADSLCTHSLAIDSSDGLHISYQFNDGTARGLKYAYKDATGWHSRLVESGSARQPSLAMDSSGTPHISYCSSPGLKHAIWDGSDWAMTTVDSSGGLPSLALDHHDDPHIA